jgi:hypothetical protein
LLKRICLKFALLLVELGNPPVTCLYRKVHLVLRATVPRPRLTLSLQSMFDPTMTLHRTSWISDQLDLLFSALSPKRFRPLFKYLAQSFLTHEQHHRFPVGIP